MYKGAVVYIRVIDGVLRSGDTVRLMSNGKTSEAMEIGFFRLNMIPCDEIGPGEVGYINTGIKSAMEWAIPAGLFLFGLVYPLLLRLRVRPALWLDRIGLPGGHADHHIQLVLFSQLGPAVHDVPIVLRRRGQACAVAHTVVVEEDAKYLVSLFQGGLGELISRIRRLMLIRPFIYLNRKFHLLSLGFERPDQKRICAEAFKLARPPRQLSM